MVARDRAVKANPAPQRARRDDDFEERLCGACGTVHIAFSFAPREAPCASCARRQTPPPAVGGRRWSRHFLAWLELGAP